MTRKEKISMYQKKKEFVEDLSAVFECRSRSTGVELLEYELWENEEQGYFQEYAIITFVGHICERENVNTLHFISRKILM